MTKKDPYREWLKEDFNKIFESLSLKEVQKHFLRSRWLDQLLWTEARAAQTRNRYYSLRLTAIIGGVIVPVMVSLNIDNARLNQAVRYLTIGLSGVVAVSAAMEEFFRYGERWHHYRRTAESLKTQGWQFFELSGSYRSFNRHEDAFVLFSDRIEEIIQRDVEVYVSQLTQEKANDKDDESSAPPLLSKLSPDPGFTVKPTSPDSQAPAGKAAPPPSLPESPPSNLSQTYP